MNTAEQKEIIHNETVDNTIRDETKKIFLLVFVSLKMPFHRKFLDSHKIKPVWDGFSEYMPNNY